MGASLIGAIAQQPLAEAGGQAPGEGDDPLGVLLDLGQVDARLAALQPLEEAGRRQPHEVAIAGVVGGQQREVVAFDAPRALVGMVVDEVDLTADDRLDPVCSACLLQLDGAVHDAVVGQPERRLIK